MRTDDLVAMLARGGGAVEPHAVARRYAIGLFAGLVGAGLLMTTLLGVRHDFEEAMRLPMFWVKLAFVATLAAASVALAMRLSRPGAALGRTPLALLAPLAAMWILALVTLLESTPAQIGPLILGQTWRSCPWLIVFLSIPVFAGMLWIMRELAPTRLRAAGAATGLVAGCVAALVYSFHCTELAAPFIGLWYVVGILVPTAVGALAGPRLLRW